MISFILLRRRLPDIERPYRSPVGEWGAAIGAVIALASLAACFWRDDCRPGVVGVAIFYVVALAYFGLVGRHRLVLSPEEEFAMTRGVHGDPEREGYGVTQREAFGLGADTAPPAPHSDGRGSRPSPELPPEETPRTPARPHRAHP